MQTASSLSTPAALDHQPLPASPGLLLPALSLCQRELVRFLRQRNRIIGAFATPVVFWLLIGAGMGHSFRNVAGAPTDGGYLQFFFPGTVLMILLFTAIFSTISIIEDRKEGFLQSVLVAPVSRLSVILGKVLGGTILAFGQGFIFLMLCPLVGLKLGAWGLLLAVFVMLVLSFSLTALGFCIAWRMSSTQGFHAIMNLFLLPLWFLSGALFPPGNVTFAPLRWVMYANPLTYGLAALRQALSSGTDPTLPNLTLCLVVSVGFAVVMLLLAGRIASTQVSADWQ